MKYKEYDVNKKLFGENYLIYDWQESAEETQIYVNSQTRTGKCPRCGQESDSYHATYKRSIQIIPVNRKTTYAKVTAYKYECGRKECEQKVFMEELPFAPRSQVRSQDLTMVILSVSLFLSNEGASKVLRQMGIKVSNDSVRRIYETIKVQDEPDVEAVGIDDVAIRKGQSYATAIYGMEDHHLIALLKGRGAETLKEWLEGHKKIRLVTRDRLSAYATAINEALPGCVQVADRFHLITNLIERMREIFRAEVPEEIFVKDGRALDMAPAKEKKLKIPPDSPMLGKYDYDNSVPLGENGEPVSYDGKKRDTGSNQYKKYAENRKKNSGAYARCGKDGKS